MAQKPQTKTTQYVAACKHSNLWPIGQSSNYPWLILYSWLTDKLPFRLINLQTMFLDLCTANNNIMMLVMMRKICPASNKQLMNRQGSLKRYDGVSHLISAMTLGSETFFLFPYRELYKSIKEYVQ